MHIDLRIHVNLHIHIDLLPTEAQVKLLTAEPRWVLRQGVPLNSQNTQRQEYYEMQKSITFSIFRLTPKRGSPLQSTCALGLQAFG